MIDDFLVLASLAGIGVALAAGPLGCFVVWRRMSYFGDTLAHSALLGVALSFLLQIEMTLATFGVCAAIALALIWLRRDAEMATDSLLGLLSHSALAVGLIVMSFISGVRVDLMGFLFGDVLAVSNEELLTILVCSLAVITGLALGWRHLFAATVSLELAEAEGLRPKRTEALFVLLLALLIAVAMKIVGVLLISAMLILPAVTARRFSTSPERMAVSAAGLGSSAVLLGLQGSLQFDTPSGPSIVVALLGLFLVISAGKALVQRLRSTGTS